MNEARALARLNHPGIVQIHEVTSAAGRACLVMEWGRRPADHPRPARGPRWTPRWLS